MLGDDFVKRALLIEHHRVKLASFGAWPLARSDQGGVDLLYGVTEFGQAQRVGEALGGVDREHQRT